MRWLRTILQEIYGLFVDDGSLALLALAWLAIVAFLLPHVGVPSQWKGFALFGGLAVILMESAVRYARRRERKVGRDPGSGPHQS